MMEKILLIQYIANEKYYSMLRTAGDERNGVIGILLPNKEHDIPKRIQMNKDFCDIVKMPKSKRELECLIEQAYERRFIFAPDLSMPLRQRNS